MFHLNTTLLENDDPAFHHCWRLNSCASCLSSRRPTCGWCPYSFTCLPTSHLLSPLTHPTICPFPSERFELRTHTLGCPISTTTFLSILISILSTSLFWILLFTAYIVYQRRRRSSFRWWGVGEGHSWGGWYPGWLFWKRRDGGMNGMPGSWGDGNNDAGGDDGDDDNDGGSSGSGGELPGRSSYGATPTNTAARGTKGVGAGPAGREGGKAKSGSDDDRVFANERRRLLGV